MKTKIEPAGISGIALVECVRVLDVMGPFSVQKLLEALEDGRVDGRWYVGDTSGHTINDEDYRIVDGITDVSSVEGLSQILGPKVEEKEFVGCLLGWGGFIENCHYSVIWERLRKRYPESRGGLYCYTTDNIEFWLMSIHQGDTPTNDRWAMTFKQIIVDFQAGKYKHLLSESESE